MYSSSYWNDGKLDESCTCDKFTIPCYQDLEPATDYEANDKAMGYNQAKFLANTGAVSVRF